MLHCGGVGGRCCPYELRSISSHMERAGRAGVLRHRIGRQQAGTAAMFRLTFGHIGALRLRCVAPRVQIALSSTSCLLPFERVREAFAGPFCERSRIFDRDVHNGVLRAILRKAGRSGSAGRLRKCEIRAIRDLCLIDIERRSDPLLFLRSVHEPAGRDKQHGSRAGRDGERQVSLTTRMLLPDQVSRRAQHDGDDYDHYQRSAVTAACLGRLDHVSMLTWRYFVMTSATPPIPNPEPDPPNPDPAPLPDEPVPGTPIAKA